MAVTSLTVRERLAYAIANGKSVKPHTVRFKDENGDTVKYAIVAPLTSLSEDAVADAIRKSGTVVTGKATIGANELNISKIALNAEHSAIALNIVVDAE